MLPSFFDSDSVDRVATHVVARRKNSATFFRTQTAYKLLRARRAKSRYFSISTLHIVAPLALSLGLYTGAAAQSVQQSGVVTTGHIACWAITGVIFDCGQVGGSSILGSYTANDLVAVNGSGSLIDSGISPVNTSNITSLWNFNGGATAPTRSSGDNSTNVATTAFVLAQGGGVTIGGTAAAGYVPVATSATAASWSGSYLPHLTTSVEGTGFPGFDGAAGGVNFFMWNAPVLGSANDSAPTLRVSRHPSGTGALFPGLVYPGLWLESVIPAGDTGFEWGILSQVANFATGGQNTALTASMVKSGSLAVGPSFGANIFCRDDTNTGANPAASCVGAEIDVGTGANNGGTDTNAQRIGLNIVAGGASGTHIAYGLYISQLTGVIYDRGITLAPNAPGGTFVTGLDTANATFNSAAIFLGAGQKIVLDGSWSGQTPSAFRYLQYNTGVFRYNVSNVDVVKIADAGSIELKSSLLLDGSGSGVVTIATQASAGTYNFNLPTTAGTSGFVLASAGGGSSPMTWANSLTAFTMAGLTTFSGQIISTFGTPTIASGACGATTNGAIAGGSTNQSGQVTIGAASTTTCTISFSTTITAPGACVIFPENAAAAATGTTVARVSAVGTTSWTITGSALANANYYYFCI